jgi:hypothetical protein
MNRIFFLSPARSSGQRAELIFNRNAGFDLAQRLHRGESVAIGEIFRFLSGLYFRGKLAYAKTFARPPRGVPGAWVITTNQGLMQIDAAIDLKQLRSFSDVDIDGKDPRYRKPLERDARRLAAKLPPEGEAILLGSISTAKYVDVLLACFGSRLKFPIEFVGRGDMSRGGLLLRSAVDRCELEYVPADGAVRRGKRPPKLPPRRYHRDELHFSRFDSCTLALEGIVSSRNIYVR